MKQPYKPLLANRLKFPDAWAGIVIQIGPYGCSWLAIADNKAFDFWRGYRSATGKAWVFCYWDEVLHCMREYQSDNRQFCAMVDLISWQLEPEQPTPKIQRELNFDNEILD